MNANQLAITMAALRKTAVFPGVQTSTAPALASGQAASSAPQGALPSQAGAGHMADIVAALNARHGLQPGANPGGPFAAPSRPAARSHGVPTPDELAALVNAEAGLQPGPNVPAALAAHFARFAQETM